MLGEELEPINFDPLGGHVRVRTERALDACRVRSHVPEVGAREFELRLAADVTPEELSTERGVNGGVGVGGATELVLAAFDVEGCVAVIVLDDRAGCEAHSAAGVRADAVGEFDVVVAVGVGEVVESARCLYQSGGAGEIEADAVAVGDRALLGDGCRGIEEDEPGAGDDVVEAGGLLGTFPGGGAGDERGARAVFAEMGFQQARSGEHVVVEREEDLALRCFEQGPADRDVAGPRHGEDAQRGQGVAVLARDGVRLARRAAVEPYEDLGWGDRLACQAREAGAERLGTGVARDEDGAGGHGRRARTTRVSGGLRAGTPIVAYAGNGRVPHRTERGVCMTEGSARVIERVSLSDVLERNLCALGQRDPELVALVERVEVSQDRGEGGADVRTVMEMLEDREHPREACAMLGFGDGAVLTHLASEGPDAGTVGTERAVFVFEPGVEAIAWAMRRADLTGVFGSDRFLLFLGPAWRERLRAWGEGPIECAPPKAAARLGAVDADVVKELGAVHERVNERAKALEGAVARRYASRTRAESAERLRAPGASLLMLTTRFSTVLCHSTEDFAHGARERGFDAQVEVEGAAHHRHTRLSLLQGVLDHDPALVLQIDHLRAENPGLFPEQLPFVCVIQDNLVNLTAPAAGPSMGPTDFATGPWVRTYVHEHAYPADRCFETVRLTRRPTRGAAPGPGDGRTLLYVSNHSGTPSQTLGTVLEMVGHDDRACSIARSVTERMEGLYAGGGCLENSSDVLELTRDGAAAHGVDRAHPAVKPLSELLATHVNNALYRQQGLAWARDAAASLGMSLEVYGAGWDEHPEFGAHARGVIAYGEALERASRESACCLMLEPFFPTSHQRSIDAWMAGGLVLARRRARDVCQETFMAWLSRLPDDVASYAEALDHIKHEDRAAFERVCDELRAYAGEGTELDLVEVNMARRRDGVGWLMELPPEYRRWSFGGADELQAALRWSVEGADERIALCARLQRWINERFGYASGVQRIVDRVASRMEASA